MAGAYNFITISVHSAASWLHVQWQVMINHGMASHFLIKLCNQITNEGKLLEKCDQCSWLSIFKVTVSPYERSWLLTLRVNLVFLQSMWSLNTWIITSAWKAFDILPCSCPKWKVAINVMVLAQLYKYSLQIRTKMPPSTIALLLLWISQYPDCNIVSSTHLLQPLASAARKFW